MSLLGYIYIVTGGGGGGGGGSGCVDSSSVSSFL